MHSINDIKTLRKFRKIINTVINWCEHYPIRSLFLLYLLFVCIKIIVTQLFLDPSNLVDGFIYMKMAGSFFQSGSFQIYGEPTHQYPPLYPILISPAYIFNDTILIFRTIKILSVLYSTLILFPAYLIAREFLDSKKSIITAIVISCLAGVVIWVFNIVSECIFYTLFLTSVYFIYKSAFEKGYKFKLLTGFFIGLCFLSRYTAIVFAPAIFLFFIIMHIHEKNQTRLKAITLSLKECIIISIPAGLTILPWLIRNGMLFGYTYKGILGYATEISSAAAKLIAIAGEITLSERNTNMPGNINMIQNFVIHILVNHGILILSCGIIFCILSVWMLHQSHKDKTTNLYAICILTILLTEFLIIVDSIHNITLPWRLHGRYLEPIFPMIIIIGIIGLTKIKHLNQKRIYIFLLTSLPLSLLIVNTWGFMGGMISVSYIGIMQDLKLYLSKFFGITINSPIHIHYSILIFLLITCMFLLFFLMIRFKISKKKIFAIACLIILASTTISAAGYMTRDAYTSNSDLYEFGCWLNKQFSGNNETIYFDEDIEQGINQLSIWINAPITVGSWNETNNSYNVKHLISNNLYNYTLEYSKNLTASLGGGIRGRDGWANKIYVYNLEE